MEETRERFMRQYQLLHSECPKCGSKNVSVTLAGYVFDERHPEEYVDRNACKCLTCGNTCSRHELLPSSQDYPKSRFIHKKTGNRYCVMSDNLMMKENGVWRKGLVLYRAMYWNPDGEFFVRTREDFEEKFEEEKYDK